MDYLLSKDEINSIIQIVDDKKSIFKHCDVFAPSIFEAQLIKAKTEYMTRSSASLSEIIKTQLETEIGNPSVFLKIWFAWDEIDTAKKTAILRPFYETYPELANRLFGDERRFVSDVVNDTLTSSLQYEANVYKYITDNIILNNISPNFIPLLTSNKCGVENVRRSMNELDPFTRKDELNDKFDVLERMFSGINLSFILTGSSESIMTVTDFFRMIMKRTVVLTRHDYTSIMFQFFYALYVLHEFRIVHNDNHTNNMLIQLLPAPVTLDIMVGSFNVKFSTKYIVKFFDWDRSFCQGVGKNPITSRVLYSRNASEFIRGRDFSAFVCFIYERQVPGFSMILDFIIDGPKPTMTSNETEKVVRNGVTHELKNWIHKNPSKVSTNELGKTYITIPKKDLEIAVASTDVPIYLREKLGKDQHGEYIYDGPNITNIFLEIEGSTLKILKGYTCNPMYDSDDLDVVKYFTDARKFEQLCTGLDSTLVGKVYKYKLNAVGEPLSYAPLFDSVTSDLSMISDVPTEPESEDVSTELEDEFSPSFTPSMSEIERLSGISFEFEDKNTDDTIELTPDDNFLYFAYDTLVKVMYVVLNTKGVISSGSVVLPVLESALVYIFDILEKYLTIDNIVNIFKIAINVVFKISKLSYKNSMYVLVNCIGPYIEMIGDENLRSLLSYMYTKKHHIDFYKVLNQTFSKEFVNEFIPEI
jgi:hypothetical protein